MEKNRRKVKSKEKKGGLNNKSDGSLSVVWRITILIYIVILLYFLFTCGGNGANWFPGKPIFTR